MESELGRDAHETARGTIGDGNRAAEVITRRRAVFSKKVAATESDAVRDVNDPSRHLLVKAERDQQGSVRFIVQDTGVGLHPQSADTLLDAFYTTNSDGTGVSLSVSPPIIESHGGKLRAEASDGPGHSFSSSIPGSPTELGVTALVTPVRQPR